MNQGLASHSFSTYDALALFDTSTLDEKLQAALVYHWTIIIHNSSSPGHISCNTQRLPGMPSYSPSRP